MNIITSNKLTEEQVLYLEQWMEYTKQSHDTNSSDRITYHLFTQEQSDHAVQLLLDQYTDYINHYNKKSQLERLYDLHPTDKLAHEITTIELYLQELGDAMKFDNPYIWMMYKYHAYQNDPTKKVQTLEDLRKHCETKTDICHKRLDYLAQQVRDRYGIDLFDDSSVDGTLDITSFMTQYPYILECSSDEDFMQQWISYEYHTNHNGGIAKRQNYSS
jgi:hypothetical protein